MKVDEAHLFGIPHPTDRVTLIPFQASQIRNQSSLKLKSESHSSRAVTRDQKRMLIFVSFKLLFLLLEMSLQRCRVEDICNKQALASGFMDSVLRKIVLR